MGCPSWPQESPHLSDRSNKVGESSCSCNIWEKRCTKATIDAAWRRKKPDHRLIVRDKDCRGLALIINPTTMTWSYAYRPRGTNPVTGRRWPNRTVTLGNPASRSPDDARTEANWTKGQ